MPQSYLSVNQRKALALFDSDGRISTHTVADKLNIPRPTAKQILVRLKDLRITEQQGQGRGAYYTLSRESEILDPRGKQLVTVYKGVDSFRGMFDRIARKLGKNDYYWSFAFRNEYHDPLVRDLLVAFHKELAKKKVDDRTIVNQEVAGIVKLNFATVPELQLRFTGMDIPVGMIVIEDAVINLIWGKQPIAIVIKTPEIHKRYHNFFLTAWGQAHESKQNELLKPGNTPLAPMHNMFGVRELWMKDESKNPTKTFKDRLAYEMVRPILELYKSGDKLTKTTFASISYGNTAKAMGYYSDMVNRIVGDVTKSIAFVPPGLVRKKFGPDIQGNIVPVSTVLANISEHCNIVPIDLKKKIYRTQDLKELAEEHKVLEGQFIDITEGLNRPAYVNIIIEAIEQQLKYSPDYIIVPFGAGILCNEIIDYINDHHLHTKVIPVSSGNPQTIAVMLYGPIWVDAESLKKKGWGWTRHDKRDRKGRARAPYRVYHVSDIEIKKTMEILHGQRVEAEPSGVSGFAILSRLHKIDKSFDPKKHSVLVINTGNGLSNYTK